MQFADTVKTCVHRTASVGRARSPQSVLVRKASVLSTGANDDDHGPPTSSLIKSSSFNGARRNTEKCFRFSPETKVGQRQAAAADGDDARRDYDDAERRRTSGSSSLSSAFSPVISPHFLEVPASADLPAGPPRRVASVGRAASFSEVEGRPQRCHPPCVPSLSVPPSTPDTAVGAGAPSDRQRARSFRANERRSLSVHHRAVRRAVSCRGPVTRRPRKSSSSTVGRASSLNEGARGRRVAAAEMAASIGSLGLFGSDFLFCSQTQLSSTADIYRRMQQRARLNAALSNDSGMSACPLLA